jgi:septum formation inhibitor MinC
METATQATTKRHERYLGATGDPEGARPSTRRGATHGRGLPAYAQASGGTSVSGLWVRGEMCEPDVDGKGPSGPGVATRALTMLRGTSAGLEFVFAGDAFDEAWAEMAARLAERPDFYRGSEATAIFEMAAPGDEALAQFLGAVDGYGIALRGIFGPEALAEVARRHALSYLGEPPRPTVASFERKRASRADRAADLTDHARSLDADFAGARADIATRRARGESSVPRPVFGPVRPSPAEAAAAPAQPSLSMLPSTLYHRGTLRGGQSLQQLGAIVVVGDVNPGAELVATGDIIVFGSLRGTAHAGAQGDTGARVYALELAATQLRIATFIAADDGTRRAREPEVAFVAEDRITIAPHSKAGS